MSEQVAFVDFVTIKSDRLNQQQRGAWITLGNETSLWINASDVGALISQLLRERELFIEENDALQKLSEYMGIRPGRSVTEGVPAAIAEIERLRGEELTPNAHL